MIRQRLHRPSLRITRHPDQSGASSLIFEVWSPFTGSYQVESSIEAAIQRVDQLSRLICQMWLQRHPKLDALMDAPDPEGGNADEWAEFRVNPATSRSYDTRQHDRCIWKRATGLAQALEITCTAIGCVPPHASASWR